ncbi:MAG: hypothetical protein LKJ64_03890 [Lentilactobacillus buchneri]|jgi:hypothetical protein|nr:hypothetical protein [Lentilactobacillus buchneri]MCI2019699.1 hypothetical protein [Lentilactobacillus buchneri]MCI2028125.1 hypothetical protein [Lentilactobacillus buchneri]
MRYTNKDYLNYVNNQDSLFYSPNLTKGFDKQKYSINTFVNSKWQHKIDNNWESYLINVDTLPNQGWKIHITANISDAQQLLEVVAKILIPKEVSFKFLPDKYSLLMANSKYADRAESGKFITIYPESTKSFLELLDILTKATRKFEEGPYILNDKQWKDSNVYFRYGGFKPIYAKVNGSIVPVVKAPDGQWVEDIRAPSLGHHITIYQNSLKNQKS